MPGTLNHPSLNQMNSSTSKKVRFSEAMDIDSEGPSESPPSTTEGSASSSCCLSYAGDKVDMEGSPIASLTSLVQHSGVPSASMVTSAAMSCSPTSSSPCSPMPSPPNLLLDVFGLGSPMPSPPNLLLSEFGLGSPMPSPPMLPLAQFPNIARMPYPSLSILSPIPSPTDHQSKGFSNMPSTPEVPLNEFGDLFLTLPTKSLATLSEDSEDLASPIICINVPAVPSDEAVPPLRQTLAKGRD
ncbi:hypothetical protein PAXINDRAFT_15122 [Paxillus involutus ATCC 200175]|uniref:Uncharacterized protein n=1 Tax=Paxillus involutus ATCC 200175 TaxID=664439 RepID=A0A0C9TXT6_PAXIN|nr:hypothetical protein PAXINDRAFT_15122 [Paxillus involutus ATCC 200175]